MDIRQEFPIFNQLVNDEPYVYLDSAASVPMPLSVQQRMTHFMNTDYANVHRGVYTLSQRASDQYEQVRQIVQQFIGAEKSSEIVFTSGTTASLNLVAQSFGEYFVQEDDEIFVSVLEHHANLIPWQELAKRKHAKLVYMPVTQDGYIDVHKVSFMVSQRTKIIAVTQCSNVLGVCNDIDTLSDLVHAKGGVIVVDGAQSVPHRHVNVSKYDFVAFSGHKLGGLTGTGVLYGKHKWLEVMKPVLFGGDMINQVDKFSSTWAQVPYKFEAGTPNILGVITLGESIKWIQNIGLDTIDKHNRLLTEHLLNGIKDIQGLTVYGTTDMTLRQSIVTFNLNPIHPHDVATGLDMEGIALRAGHHCAQPLMRYLNVSSTVRASVYIYNTLDDIEQFIIALKRVKEYFK
ncbi:aminotransferase class V-fold PLP-dependent enzyme [Granulicatella sp. 19428wC4_WM01]|uniref:aminotransferase class V-fold PLP-dependent enzyme n=1 Tax=unclassified Granulicatella TaxID=2630493 RepID=UPI00351C4414